MTILPNRVADFPHGVMVLSAIYVTLLVACATNGGDTIEELEAREDSLELATAYTGQEAIRLSVTPDFETKPVLAGRTKDAVDDPAVWVHPGDPALSMIIGSNKRCGIATYDLHGMELAYYPVGHINNVDVAYGVKIGDRAYDIVGGTNRTDQSIDLFRIEPETRTLIDIADGPMKVDTSLMDDVDGFCFYQSQRDSSTYLVINAKNGRFQQYRLTAGRDSLVAISKVRDLVFDSQVEDMVADNLRGVLYIGEEDRGVWKMDAEPDGNPIRTLLPMSDTLNPQIAFDIEGVTLYERGGTGYLIVSSQGNFSFAVFDLMDNNPYLFSFKIVGDTLIDKVEGTDRLHALSDSLGPQFPHGILVVQDGFNHDGDSLVSQNFKIVDWRKIASLYP